MIKTLPITEARKNLTKLVDRSGRLMEKYIITVNGKPESVLMSHEEYEGWIETMDILSEPGALKEIKQAEKEIEEGKGIPWEDVKKDLNL